ncbi:ATP-dependent DNA helicase PIF1 [Ilyonectria robusta]
MAMAMDQYVDNAVVVIASRPADTQRSAEATPCTPSPLQCAWGDLSSSECSDPSYAGETNGAGTKSGTFWGPCMRPCYAAVFFIGGGHFGVTTALSLIHEGGVNVNR